MAGGRGESVGWGRASSRGRAGVAWGEGGEVVWGGAG